MNTLWLASNAIALVLLARLSVRRILPWYRAFLALMLVQAIVLNFVRPNTRIYAYLWSLSESLLVLLEGASVLELISLFLRGRLNARLGQLRRFGLAVWIFSLLAALVPLMAKPDAGWGWIFRLVVSTRGYLALGMLVFLTVTSWILARQPVPVAKGLVWHARFLAANFGVLAFSMFAAATLPRDHFASSQTFLFASSALVFAGWTAALWRAPVNVGELEVDAEEARQAADSYREFRDQVRALKP